MRKKIVAGNWKMHGRTDQIKQLLSDLVNAAPHLPDYAACVVFPPAIYMALVKDSLQHSPIEWGGQNCHPAESGAFTGEHAVTMFKDLGCRYMLVGHSERRRIFNESENFIAEKFHQVKVHGMIPILCVGETLEERQHGQTEDVLCRQLQRVIEINKRSFQQAAIAYEPVWAIGTGQTATPEQAQSAHAFIREQVKKLNDEDADIVPILYGGSVNENNSRELFEMPDVDGGLVGGASLQARQFLEIIKCIS